MPKIVNPGSERPTTQTETVDPDSNLRPSELAHLKQRLEKERQTVRAKLLEHISAANEGDVELPDEMDQASRDQERGYLLRVADKEQKLLEELEHALNKIEAGTYGLCEGTDEPIGFSRLEARPWARYSVAYKEFLEREERGRKPGR